MSTSLLICMPATPSLHSYPTRRSSDLNVAIDNMSVDHRIAADAEREGLPVLGRVHRPGIQRNMAFDGLFRQRRHVSLRSEEHTAELQSHSEIVFRLLLEIKKIVV